MPPGLPALLLFFGMMLLPDTPNSLAERERPDQARKVLERIRGSTNVEEEMRGIISAVENSKKVQHITSCARQALPVVKSVHVQAYNACRGLHEGFCLYPETAQLLPALDSPPDSLARSGGHHAWVVRSSVFDRMLKPAGQQLQSTCTASRLTGRRGRRVAGADDVGRCRLAMHGGCSSAGSGGRSS